MSSRSIRGHSLRRFGSGQCDLTDAPGARSGRRVPSTLHHLCGELIVATAAAAHASERPLHCRSLAARYGK